MTTTQTIDVRGLDHAQKQERIFPAVDSLKQEEALRIVFDFNPLPLVYMFKARNEFDLSFEKEGPKEWILRIARLAPAADKPADDKKAQFKQLLSKLRVGNVSAETKAEAKKLLQSVDAKTLALLEQELIREGVSHDEIRKSLCDVHLEVLRDSLVKQRIEVKALHPVHTFMEEHKLILRALNDLKDLVKRLANCGSFADMGADLEKLKEVSHLFVDAAMHYDREEQCLFPMLVKHDITEPPAIMKAEHVEFLARKKKLYQMANNHEDYDFATFKREVMDIGEYLPRELDSHIFKEDNILYQIALQVLTQEEWDEVKKQADKIGYCCFKPEDHK